MLENVPVSRWEDRQRGFSPVCGGLVTAVLILATCVAVVIVAAVLAGGMTWMVSTYAV